MIEMMDLRPIAGRFEPLKLYGEEMAGEVNAVLARRRRRAAARRVLALLAAACAWVGVGMLLGFLATHI